MINISRISCCLLVISILFIGCKDEKIEISFTNIYLMVDVTDASLKDKGLLLSSTAEILKVIGVNTASGGYSGGELKIFTINELSNSQSTTIYLKEGVKGLLGHNPLDRIDEIKAFESDVSEAFNKMLNKVEWDKNQSKIYQNVCRELNKLFAESSNHKKVFIIFSDMLENSDLFSFYKEAQIQKAMKDIPSFITNTLERDCILPDLDGIKIYVVTNRKPDIDAKVNLAEQFWNELFSLKNADIEFDSELDIN